MKIVIVGAGLSGATLARLHAENGDEVTVVDKRNHIAGNAYDFINHYGIMESKYGAHIFHNSHEDVQAFLNRFTEWTNYRHVVKSVVDDKLVDIPVTLDTYNKILGPKWATNEELKSWIESQSEIDVPKNSEESALKRLGSTEIYEKMFKNYTKKQWDKYPIELDASVMDRIPVRLEKTNRYENERYFNDKYEGIPINGYTELVKNMLDHENIRTILGRDFHKMGITDYDRLYYTGKIDTYFGEKFGKLEYRSLEFETETLKGDYQYYAVINYPDESVPFTRIIEHKKIYNQSSPLTTITREYSKAGGEPYYPVPNKANRDLYNKYKEMSKGYEEQGIYFVGRLASYKYFNMNDAVKNAMDLFYKLKYKS